MFVKYPLNWKYELVEIPRALLLQSADGEFRILANNAGEGLALNQLNSSFLPGGESFSYRFGLNNLFNGTGADDINVSDYLISNAEFLATGPLNGGALVVGDAALFSGDGSISSAMNNVFTTTTSFAAAGNFATQTETLNNYIDKIIGDAAYRANDARSNTEITTSLLEQTKTTIQNI